MPVLADFKSAAIATQAEQLAALAAIKANALCKKDQMRQRSCLCIGPSNSQGRPDNAGNRASTGHMETTAKSCPKTAKHTTAF